VGAGSGHEARALDARGYRVTVVDLDAASIPDVLVADFLVADFAGAYDLVCEHGAYPGLPAAAYVSAAARALRPGGQVFGVFPGRDVGGLIRVFASAFEPQHLEGSAADPGLLEAVFERR
jgi:SAM-dependent methyltransferase